MAELGEALGQGTPARPTRSQRQRLPGGGGGGSTDGWGEHAAAGSALHATSMAASSAASSSVAGEAGGGQDAGDEDSEAVYERQNPEEVLGRLPKDWAAKVLKASKWQDKKELLDKLLAITAGPRLAAADYSEVPCGERARKPLLCLCFASGGVLPHLRSERMRVLAHTRPPCRVCLDECAPAGSQELARADGRLDGARRRVCHQGPRYPRPGLSLLLASLSSLPTPAPRGTCDCLWFGKHASSGASRRALLQGSTAAQAPAARRCCALCVCACLSRARGCRTSPSAPRRAAAACQEHGDTHPTPYHTSHTQKGTKGAR